jgi:outer membrane protein assembly factor BamA
MLGSEVLGQPSKELADVRLFEDVVVAPIPISNPTVGTGLAVVVMPFYKLGEGSPLSNTAVAAAYMSSGTWGVGATQSTRLRGDFLRLDGLVGYADVRYRFYGVGSSAGSSGVSVPIAQKAFAFVPEVLARVAQRLFVGLRYRGVDVETSLDTDQSSPLDSYFPGGSVSITSSGFGPVVVWDTRDNDMNPSSGAFVDLRGNHADEAMGSDFTYRTYTLGANAYRRIGAGVLGVRGFACAASENTPLFDLCMYGVGSDLRGYEAGRYRDRAMLAAQAEYRHPLGGRWGLVAFGGTGQIAGSFGAMDGERWLPSVGGGVRWLASKEARVNLSVDVAFGRDSTAWYVYVKEAF